MVSIVLNQPLSPATTRSEIRRQRIRERFSVRGSVIEDWNSIDLTPTTTTTCDDECVSDYIFSAATIAGRDRE